MVPTVGGRESVSASKNSEESDTDTVSLLVLYKYTEQ